MATKNTLGIVDARELHHAKVFPSESAMAAMSDGSTMFTCAL